MREGGSKGEEMFVFRCGWHEEQRTALKEFLIISYSSYRFLPWEIQKDMTTAMQA